jgi:hypothetical protein
MAGQELAPKLHQLARLMRSAEFDAVTDLITSDLPGPFFGNFSRRSRNSCFGIPYCVGA